MKTETNIKTQRQIHHNYMKFYFLTYIFSILSIGLFAQCIEGECENGEGVFMNKDGDLYTGTFSAGKLDGKGICHFSWGTKYVGEWTDGNFNGKGSYYYPDGKIESGTWKNGILDQSNAENSSASKFHAIVIGIDNYDDCQLKYTTKDASSTYHFLTNSQVSTQGSGDIRLLLNSAATVEKFKSSLENIQTQSTENDVFMFFFFGEGQKSTFDLADGSITFQELDEMLGNIKASQKMSFIDLTISSDGVMFAAKGKATTSSLDNNSTIISLEKEFESTIEYDGLRLGVMKHFLNQSLRGASDKNVDGELSADEIYTYLTKKIKSYSDGYLMPELYTGSAD